MINYSFIIPHHNVPDLLSRLLNTIPQRKDIEIIVVDDNSDDDKKPDISRSDTKVVFIPAAESKGAGHARNVGLSLANGRWLLFADSDDFYVNGFISYLDNYLESKADIVLFSAYIDYVPGDENNLPNRNYIEKSFDLFYKSSRNPTDVKRVGALANVPWNKMFKHGFIKRINDRFEEIPLGNDAWFSKFAGANCESVEIIDSRLYYYVKYSNGITYRHRPLSHYYQAIDSNTRRNILLHKNGLNDLIEFPGFHKHNILRDFGRYTYVKLCVYKLFSDPTYLRTFLNKGFKKIISPIVK